MNRIMRRIARFEKEIKGGRGKRYRNSQSSLLQNILII